MPNWCENDLYIYGPRREEIADAIQGDTGVIDFEKILPMPKELEVTLTPGHWDDAVALIEPAKALQMLRWPWVEEEAARLLSCRAIDLGLDGLKTILMERTPDLMARVETMKACKAATGYTNWYDWRCDHWGVKWNVEGGDRMDHVSRIRLTFSTAWSPPKPIVMALSEKYPTSKFSLRFYECGEGFKGHYAVKGGVVQADAWDKSYRGRRGG